jgi:Ca2+-binding EF-hand superfamily protein
MGGSASVAQSEAIQMAKYELLGQREKPSDANDIKSLDAAIIEICKLRSLCRQLDPSLLDSILANAGHGQKQENDLQEHTVPKHSPQLKIRESITLAVKDKFVHRLSSLQEAFRVIDIRNTGFITKQEFLSACWDWGVHLEENDISLLDTITSGDLREIRYEDFIGIMGNIVNRGDLELASDSASLCSVPLTDEVRETIRSRIKSSDLTMRQAFQKFDLDRSGSIDRGEMQQVLTALQVPHTPEQFETLFSLYDSNGDGQFQYFEFVKIIQQDTDLNLLAASVAASGPPLISKSTSGSTSGHHESYGHGSGVHPSPVVFQRDPRKDSDELTLEVIRKIDNRFSSIKNCLRDIDSKRTGFVSSADFLRVSGLMFVCCCCCSDQVVANSVLVLCN